MTNVNLTGEDYRRVENAYAEVVMDKKDFCRLWLEHRGNQLVEELIDAVNHLCKRAAELKSELDAAKEETEKVRSQADANYRIQSLNAQSHLNDLGRKILCNLGEDDFRIYDILEEEFTLDFIIRVKLEEDFELSEDERKYLISKI